MAKKPIFSVIIPTLNEEKYLPLLLDDLGCQSFRDFEVVVADGQSSDQTVKSARKKKKLLPKLKIVFSPKRHVCVQRNLGAVYSQGSWLVFLDADSRLPPFFLQGLKYKLEAYPTDIATCWQHSDRDSSLDNAIAMAMNLGTELVQNKKDAFFSEALTIASRSAFNLIGGFDENVHYSESRHFTNRAKELGLRFTVYRDPYFVFCFRRIRKYGKLQMIGKLAKLEISTLLGSDFTDRNKIKNIYPMEGGSLFDSPTYTHRREHFINQIKKMYQEINTPKKFTGKFLHKLLDE